MKKFITLFAIMISGCAALPKNPNDLLPSPSRLKSISTQEAILPNTTHEQIFKRMKDYANKCLLVTKKIDCGRNCKPSIVQFTPTIVNEPNRITLLLQKKGSSAQLKSPDKNGVYLMMAESKNNGSAQQIIIHGMDSFQHGYTTQPTMDWLADKKKKCPKF